MTPEELREEAVEILLCIADLYEHHPETWESEIPVLACSNPLARAAWLIAFDGTTDAEDALEAASLVIAGWNPGDPVDGAYTVEI